MRCVSGRIFSWLPKRIFSFFTIVFFFVCHFVIFSSFYYLPKKAIIVKKKRNCVSLNRYTIRASCLIYHTAYRQYFFRFCWKVNIVAGVEMRSPFRLHPVCRSNSHSLPYLFISFSLFLCSFLLLSFVCGHKCLYMHIFVLPFYLILFNNLLFK